MLRRIAVHVAGTCPSASPSELVKFIPEDELEPAHGISQEVLQLLASGVAGAQGSPERKPHDTTRRLALKAAGGLDGSPPPWHGQPDGVRVQRRDSPADGGEVLSPPSGESSREDAVAMLGETVRTRPAVGLELCPHLSDTPICRARSSQLGAIHEHDDAEAIVDVPVAAALRSGSHSRSATSASRRTPADVVEFVMSLETDRRLDGSPLAERVQLRWHVQPGAELPSTVSARNNQTSAQSACGKRTLP